MSKQGQSGGDKGQQSQKAEEQKSQQGKTPDQQQPGDEQEDTKMPEQGGGADVKAGKNSGHSRS